MKRLLFSFLLFIPLFVCAQISKINISSKHETIVVPYDSIKNINRDNYKSQIGQTLYLKESEQQKKRKGYMYFYTKPTFDFSSVFVYKPNSYLGYSDYDYMKNRYFYVDDIIMDPRGQSKELYAKNGYLKLIDTESKDTIFYNFSFGGVFSEFITVGFYEKLKKNWIGYDFIYVKSSFDEDKGLMSLSNKNNYVKIPEGTILKCTDVSIEDGGDNTIYAILEAPNVEPVIVKLYLVGEADKKWGGNVQRLDYYKSNLAKKEQHKKELTRKYGVANANKILDGLVVLGWSKAMCIESWGEPSDINKTTGSYGVHEQWVYGFGSYLYFENGKLTDIQN